MFWKIKEERGGEGVAVLNMLVWQLTLCVFICVYDVCICWHGTLQAGRLAVNTRITVSVFVSHCSQFLRLAVC